MWTDEIHRLITLSGFGPSFKTTPSVFIAELRRRYRRTPQDLGSSVVQFLGNEMNYLRRGFKKKVLDFVTQRKEGEVNDKVR